MSRIPGIITALVVVGTGVLAGAASLIRWWGACYPSAVASSACWRRRGDEYALHGFTALPAVLHAAAALMALSGVLSAALWFTPLAIVPRQRWREIALAVGALVGMIDPAAELGWHVAGQRLLDPVLAFWISVSAWSLLALITYAPSQQFIAAEAVASRRRGGARLTLIFIALFVSGPIGTFLDALTFHWAYNSPKISPGEGLLRASVLVLLGLALLLTCRGPRSPYPDNEPEADPPEYTLAA